MSLTTEPELATETLMSAGIATLAREIGEALGQAASEVAAAPKIEAALARALACDDLLPEEMLLPSFGSYRQEVLHVDSAGRFSIAALIWLPGHRTPIHDHRCWCCFGVWRGREVETHYVIDEAGELKAAGQSICYRGDVEFLIPPGDIHQVSNDDMVPTVSIHIYGADLRRVGTSIHRRYEDGQARVRRQVAEERRTVAVVGGGFSGTLTAVHLLRGSGPETRIILFEPAPEAGKGAAYGTHCLSHLLNVPAGGMSAFADEPEHFLEWCRRKGRTAQAGDFLPRLWYGEYLASVLKEEVLRSSARFEIRMERVEEITGEGRKLRLAASDGETVEANAVVLALGCPPGRQRLSRADGWPAMSDPWKPGILEYVKPNDSILIVGTGLTFMDLLAELSSRGHRGRITAISRRGLLPSCHQPANAAAPFDAGKFRERLAAEPMHIARLCRVVREAVNDAQAAGTDWREVINALRPLTAGIWAALPKRERRRFCRHLKPFWEVLRHRVAPATLDAARRLREEGLLEQGRGSLIDLKQNPDGRFEAVWGHPAGNKTCGTYDRVINATGFSSRLSNSGSPLLRQLYGKGWIREDELGLGIDTSSDYRLVDQDGDVLPSVYYVGPMLRARFWECTAVPELRLRAAEAATGLLAALGRDNADDPRAARPSGTKATEAAAWI